MGGAIVYIYQCKGFANQPLTFDTRARTYAHAYAEEARYTCRSGSRDESLDSGRGLRDAVAAAHAVSAQAAGGVRQQANLTAPDRSPSRGERSGKGSRCIEGWAFIGSVCVSVAILHFIVVLPV